MKLIIDGKNFFFTHLWCYCLVYLCVRACMLAKIIYMPKEMLVFVCFEGNGGYISNI